MFLEKFASCMMSSEPAGAEQFANEKKEKSESLLVVILYLVFYVAMVLLVAFVGTLLWNSNLVPAVTCLKKVSVIQLLGIYFLVRFFLA